MNFFHRVVMILSKFLRISKSEMEVIPLLSPPPEARNFSDKSYLDPPWDLIMTAPLITVYSNENWENFACRKKPQLLKRG